MGIRENVLRLMDEVQGLESRLGIRPVSIVAVTKTRTVEEIKEAIQAGMTRIGENRVQEAESKFSELDLPVEKRLIGHLQENKVNKALQLFDTLDSLDSLSTARRLDRRCAEIGRRLPVLVEINTSGETSKNGLEAGQAAGFIAELNGLSQLDVQGLMTIGPLTQDEQPIRAAFRSLLKLREDLLRQFPHLKLPVLSMGMSGDYRIAIEEGSSMIRPGTLLFGQRDYSI